ncbi:MAG: 6-phosphogluconolactonase [Paracoccus sp. (in: a-proteobacteria)]|uniref:6-phosphogluconolactonase n=1 Tax=Paracoccus sp. TaxID=267 RepID=UPI0026DEE2AD|nr:6-phosphogluconolactonase [Paracoccus sp. (in: a-proteobacteria)]MDO5632680.1 6-phosphogluconolactonase [Paracoccus sp. (in: a-proteobacteria)]
MQLIEYPDRDFLALSLAQTIAGQLAQHLRTAERASLSVPGGTTPAPVFDTLSGTDLDWGRVSVILGDERWVDGEHPRSNARLLRRHLLRDKAAVANHIPLYTGDADPETAADMVAAQIAPHLPLTVALLGMGHDMHTASLFPDAPMLARALASDAPPVMAIRADSAGEPRITLTAPVLRGALAIHLMILGPEKREVLDKAASLPPEQAPIRAFLDNATVHWAE